jgi:hypothetical protein
MIRSLLNRLARFDDRADVLRYAGGRAEAHPWRLVASLVAGGVLAGIFVAVAGRFVRADPSVVGLAISAPAMVAYGFWRRRRNYRLTGSRRVPPEA